MVQGVNWNFWILGYLGSPELGSKLSCFILPRSQWKMWVSLREYLKFAPTIYRLYRAYQERSREHTAGVLSQGYQHFPFEPTLPPKSKYLSGRSPRSDERESSWGYRFSAKAWLLEEKEEKNMGKKSNKTPQVLHETNSSPLLHGKQHLQYKQPDLNVRVHRSHRSKPVPLHHTFPSLAWLAWDKYHIR